MKRIVLRTLAWLCLFPVFSACGDGNSLTQPPITGIEILSRVGVSDTITAELPDALKVRIRGPGGNPVRGVEVSFQAERYTSSESDLKIGAWVARSGSKAFRLSVADTTDTDGIAQVAVMLGTVARDVAVMISVPSLQYSAEALYTVQPGAAARIVITPSDTAIYVDRSYSLSATVTDRFGNPRPDVATLLLEDSDKVTLSGRTATAQAIGRARFIAISGAHQDTAFLSVVPEGRIAAAAIRGGTGDTTRVVMLNLDGSDYRRFDVDIYDEPYPQWTTSGSELLLQSRTLHGYENHIVVSDVKGLRRRLIDPTLGLAQDASPQMGRDGWIYFSADPGNVQGHEEIWRVRLDGTGAERVGLRAGYYAGDLVPSPSPDGQRVVYGTTRDDCCSYVTLRVQDLVTGKVERFIDRIGIGAEIRPRWSPTDNNLFAFGTPAPQTTNIHEHEIFVVNADAGHRTRISPDGRTYRPGFGWSPDARWIIAQNFKTAALELIEVNTGLVLPLAFTRGLAQPAWRP